MLENRSFLTFHFCIRSFHVSHLFLQNLNMCPVYCLTMFLHTMNKLRNFHNLNESVHNVVGFTLFKLVIRQCERCTSTQAGVNRAKLTNFTLCTFVAFCFQLQIIFKLFYSTHSVCVQHVSLGFAKYTPLFYNIFSTAYCKPSFSRGV